MKAVLLIDDLDHADGKRTEADATHVLSLDGMAVELDLTAEHYKELEYTLNRWFQAGHKPSGPAATPVPPAGGTMSASRVYYRGLREWADAAGKSDAYLTKSGSGKTYYPRWLRAEYDAYLEGQH